MSQVGLRSLGIITSLIAFLFAVTPGPMETEKLLDTTLFHSTEEHYRWSEGSIVNLDGKDHMLMAVTLFGAGGHDNTAAQILEFRSRDGGLTWTLLEKARVLQENVGEENTMSPALLKLAGGDLLCFVNVKNSIRDCGPWVKRSTDGGETWGQLCRLPYEGYGGVGCDRAIQIHSGRVLLPCWVSTDELGSSRVWVFRSDDEGESWERSDMISTPKGSTGRRTDPAAEEPMIIELKGGRLMMIMRTYLKSIYRCFSSDGGVTWTTPEATGIPAPGSMATIKRLPDGNILLIWNWARPETIDGPWPRNFLSAAISQDEGESFSYLRHLDGADDFQGKITMANVAYASGGKVIITYSKSMTKKNAYNWQLQVLPLAWFYEGDESRIYAPAMAPDTGLTRAPSKAAIIQALERVAPHIEKDGEEEKRVAAREKVSMMPNVSFRLESEWSLESYGGIPFAVKSNQHQEPLHPQHCQIGRFHPDMHGNQVFIHNKRAELEMLDGKGGVLWNMMPPRNFPLGAASPCKRQKFHVFDPTAVLPGHGVGGTDLLVFTDAGWPYVIDGYGRRVLEVPYTENMKQDWGDVPGRPDDYGYGYYARTLYGGRNSWSMIDASLGSTPLKRMERPGRNHAQMDKYSMRISRGTWMA